jgi:MFS transporter, FHS family, Na+ dependent glucose transporter 1
MAGQEPPPNDHHSCPRSDVANLKRNQTTAFYISFIALGLAFSALGPTLPGLAANTGATISQISILFTVQALGLLLGNFLSGRQYDRAPAFPFLAMVVLVTAGMLALIPLMSNLWLLAGLMLVLGLAAGSIDVGGNTLLVWIHGDQVGPRMNALHFFFGVGALLSPIFVAQAIGLTGGITWAYWTLALLVLPAAILFLRLPSPAAPARIAQARIRAHPLAAGRADDGRVLPLRRR